MVAPAVIEMVGVWAEREAEFNLDPFRSGCVGRDGRGNGEVWFMSA